MVNDLSLWEEYVPDKIIKNKNFKLFEEDNFWGESDFTYHTWGLLETLENSTTQFTSVPLDNIKI